MCAKVTRVRNLALLGGWNPPGPSQLVRSCENSALGCRFPVGELRESLDVAKLGVAQSAQRGAVEIDETQPAAA